MNKYSDTLIVLLYLLNYYNTFFQKSINFDNNYDIIIYSIVELVNVRDIILSIGWSISSIFILSTVLYLFFIKRKNNNYNNKIFNLMVGGLLFLVILEILSVYTISMRDKIPVINEIVCRMYLYIVFLWSFTTFEHMAYYDSRIPKKPLRIMETIMAIGGLIMCIIVPIDYTTSVPYAVCGKLTIYIISYTTIGSLLESLFIMFKLVKLKDVAVFPYLFASLLLISLVVYQFITNDFMNLISTFLAFIVAYQFYNTESQDSVLLDKFKEIKKESDAKNAERDEFISNLSTEIRTPMSNIVGFSNLIMLEKNKIDLNTIKKDGVEIHKEAINLLNIINNILDLSRFEAGKEIKEEREYSFEKSILDINSEIMENYKDLKLSYKFVNDFPSDLYGDNLKIEKLVMAIIEYLTKNRNGKTLLLEFSYDIIEDSFINIKLTFNLANVGVDGSLRQNKLNLEKQIIESYNNVLESSIKYIQDTDNNMICSLSIKQKVMSDRKIENIIEKIKESSTKNQNMQVGNYSDNTVLIVDDSQMNINIAKRLFVKYGFVIEEAISGEECIKKVQEKKYDIVFLDDMMPGLSGVQTLGELKNIGIDLPPVVALTANSYDGLKDEYVKNGFTDYLAKPIESNKLNKIIIDLLGDKGGE